MFDDVLRRAAEGDFSDHPYENRSIGRQWLPRFIRWPIKCIVLPFVILDMAAQFISKKIIPPPFKKTGKCKKSGNCCRYILMKKCRWPLNRIFLFWHTQINGFYLLDRKPYKYKGVEFYVMSCRYLLADGLCKHYRFRPSICRTWPRIEHFGYPQFLKGCGYNFICKKSRV